MSEELESCDHCASEDRVTVLEIDSEDVRLCSECLNNVSECNSCSERCFVDDLTYFAGVHFCEVCRDRALSFCEHCDNYYYTSRGCDCDVDDEDRRVEGIYPYSHKPYAYFHSVLGDQLVISTYGHQGSALYVGCELETETINGSRADTLDAWSTSEFFYLKDDCSLNNGYEVVSHPATLGAWELLRSDVAQRFRCASANDVRAWTRSRCGLHFHLSRAAFTPAHTMRFHKFIMENVTEMIAFAGRESDYGSFYSDNGKASDRAKGYSQPSRGCAINYYNDNTIELRFFRPTLDPDGFYGILQFVFAVYEYTRQLRAHDVANGGFVFAGFVAWLVGRDEYSDALARIVVRVPVKVVQ